MGEPEVYLEKLSAFSRILRMEGLSVSPKETEDASRLLILDEPITGLDPAAAQDLYKTLAYLNKTEGMAVVMVTHDLKAALRSARTVLHIGRQGTFLGTPAQYLASPMGRRFQEEQP